jgi:SET domain-containing protein
MKKILAGQLPKLYLAPSPGKGVGVFAFRRIRKGERINDWTNDDWQFVKKKNAKGKLRALCEHFGVWDDDGYHVPKDWHRMSISWYINHSDTPNVAKPNTERAYALREIKPGEELFIDYTAIGSKSTVPNDFRRLIGRPRRR